MKPNLPFVSLLIAVLVGFSACTQIKLSGSDKNAVPANSPNLLQPATNAGPPPLAGEWEIDYEFKGEVHVSNITLAQNGTQLNGQGVDQSGLNWNLEEGLVADTKVNFKKVYVNVDPPRPPVVYNGDLKYLESPEYTGWMMEGVYSTQAADGKSISGKWVANPTQVPVAEQAPAPSSPAAPSIGNAKPSDISGRYDVSYQYDFKKINAKMWLKQDGSKITGDGVDTTTGEKFVISKGSYNYPKLMIVRQYKKGAGAKSTRTIIFKAQISADGANIVWDGETQYGGHWDAHLVR